MIAQAAWCSRLMHAGPLVEQPVANGTYQPAIDMYLFQIVTVPHVYVCTHVCTYAHTHTHTHTQSGGDCMVLPTVKAEDLPVIFPKGVTVKDVPSGKKYIRITPQPE